MKSSKFGNMQLRLVKHTSRLANKTGDSLEQSEPWHG